MSKAARFIGVLLLAMIIALAAPPGLQVRAQDKLNVVTTTGMVADLVSNVGGDRVEVTALMGPGVDPHLYRATAGDVQRLQRANVIFYSGLHLEAKLGEILERLQSRVPTFAITADIAEEKLLGWPQYPDQHDPHVWFDVSLWAETTHTIEKALSELDAAHAADYAARAEAFRARLAVLDQYIKEAIATIPEQQRLMITAHDAFAYFGRRYGIEVTGLQGVSTEAEAGAEDVRRLVELIVERQVPALFVESSIPARTIEAVKEAAKARGHDVRIGGTLFSDAMGDAGTLEGTYIGMVLYNTTVITTALGGKAPALPEALADYQEVVDRGMAIGNGETA